MNISKHTPGPWVLDGGTIRDADKEFVSRVALTRYVDGRRDPEAEANAVLMAAAPALVAALHGTLEAFRTCIGNDAFADFKRGHAAIRAAYKALKAAGVQS